MIAKEMQIGDDAIKRIWIDGVIREVRSNINHENKLKNFPNFDNNDTTQKQKLILVLDHVFEYGKTAAL